jgi:hypothetical protein
VDNIIYVVKCITITAHQSIAKQSIVLSANNSNQAGWKDRPIIRRFGFLSRHIVNRKR